jgi:pimeloyl-ACP methyl ester carboxylesterase
MPYADCNGQRIYYEDTGGSGPPVILAHGFLMDHSMFDAQVAALAPEFRLIRWDQRAFGRTEWDGRPFTSWDSASDCLALLDHLGIERAVVGGMSQGGFLSLRVALLRPERVKALILISTAAGLYEDDQVRAGSRQMAAAWTPVDAMLHPIAQMLLGAPEHWEPWVTRWRAFSRESCVAAVECLLNRDDITPRLGEITCPVLVIHGTSDVSIPFAQAELLREKLSGCKGLVRVEGAAHASNVTHPSQVNPPLLEFLRAYA